MTVVMHRLRSLLLMFMMLLLVLNRADAGVCDALLLACNAMQSSELYKHRDIRTGNAMVCTGQRLLTP